MANLNLLIDNGADMHDFDDEGVSVFYYAITYKRIYAENA